MEMAFGSPDTALWKINSDRGYEISCNPTTTDRNFPVSIWNSMDYEFTFEANIIAKRLAEEIKDFTLDSHFKRRLNSFGILLRV